MAVDAKKRGLSFLGDKHLLDWLTRSPEGLKLLGEAAVKWANETHEGAEWIRKEIDEAQHTKPRVLVVLWGNGEVEVFADSDARIKVVNIKGAPALRDLTESEVGLGWYDLAKWPNPLPPVRRESGQVLTTGQMQSAEREAAMSLKIAELTAALKRK